MLMKMNPDQQIKAIEIMRRRGWFQNKEVKVSNNETQSYQRVNAIMKKCYGENADYRVLTENKKVLDPEKNKLEQANIEYSQIVQSQKDDEQETPVKNNNNMREIGTMVSKDKFMTPVDPLQTITIPAALPSKKRDIPTFLSGLDLSLDQSKSQS